MHKKAMWNIPVWVWMCDNPSSRSWFSLQECRKTPTCSWNIFLDFLFVRMCRPVRRMRVDWWLTPSDCGHFMAFQGIFQPLFTGDQSLWKKNWQITIESRKQQCDTYSIRLKNSFVRCTCNSPSQFPASQLEESLTCFDSAAFHSPPREQESFNQIDCFGVMVPFLMWQVQSNSLLTPIIDLLGACCSSPCTMESSSRDSFNEEQNKGVIGKRKTHDWINFPHNWFFHPLRCLF